jgi:hypothetical protein
MAKKKATGSTSKSRASGSKAAGGAQDRQPMPERSFTPETLDSTIIALPLLQDMDKDADPDHLFDVVIDVNLNYYGGRDEAKQRIHELIKRLMNKHDIAGKGLGVHPSPAARERAVSTAARWNTVAVNPCEVHVVPSGVVAILSRCGVVPR